MLVLASLEHVELVKLSAAEITAKKKQCYDKIRNAVQNLHDSVREEENSEFYKNLHGFRERQILDIANAYAELIELGEFNMHLDGISMAIIEMLRKEGFKEGVINNVARYLPDEYKRKYTYKASIEAFEHILQIQSKDLDLYSLEQLKDYVQKVWEVSDVLKDRTKNTLSNLDLNEEHAREIAKTKYNYDIPRRGQKDKDVISTIPIDPLKGKAWNACIEVYNSFVDKDYEYTKAWLKLADKLEKYPPGEQIEGETVLNKDDDVEIARFLLGKKQSIISDLRMLKSFTDDKYAFSLSHWYKVIVDEDNYGKHAAAVKNKVNPKGSTTKPRPLTRERVGDTKENYWKYMKDQAESMGYDCWWKGVAEIWDDKYHAPYNADRRNREGPKLSETAFGSSSDEE